jgi:tRNA-modifying protein YgfZ
MSQNNRLFRLDHSELLLVSGPDAAKFLQGQVTCDVRELTTGVSCIGAQCNPKGRVLLTFRALQMNAETIALRMPANMIDIAKKTLGKYIVFSKAQLEETKDKFTLFGVYGDKAAQTLVIFFDKLPIENNNWVEKNGDYLIQLDTNRFEAWIKKSDSEKFVNTLNNAFLQTDINEWTLLNIQAGIADIVPETYELFTPQEINYQLINGVNFRKGCYTGQEIVARLHYKGKLKRHMFRFSLKNSDATKNLLPGTTVIHRQTGNTQGHIVIAAYTIYEKENGAENETETVLELLASVLDEDLDQLQIGSSTEKVEQLPLPYAIPTAV